MTKDEFYQECCLRAMTVFLSDADSKDKTPGEITDIVTSVAIALTDAVFRS